MTDAANEAWVDLPPQVEEPFEVYVNGFGCRCRERRID